MAIPENHKWRYIFHFTDIHNLDSIIKNGLLCPNLKKEKKIEHKNIANMTIQARRAKVDVPVGPEGKIHDYVPFYFSSINPMLLTLLNQKNVDQNHIIYLCLKIDRLDDKDTVFTDASANRIEMPVFYSDTDHLNQLNWELIDSKKWGTSSEEDKHKKMAEALIHHKIDIDDIDGIVVYNEGVKKAVEHVFKENGKKPPVIMFDHDQRIRNYSFYYTKFFIKSQSNNSLVTGPLTLYGEYRRLLKNIVKIRKNKKEYTYQTVADLVTAIDDNFSVLSELKELSGLQQDYRPHNDTVEEHTKKVVAEIKKQAYYNQVGAEMKSILVLSAYLHDMGKGPKSKWKDGVMKGVYPDHPADAIPMLERILTEEVSILSEEDIRLICMLVVYHDIVGDCLENGREKEQIARIITNEDDFEMLYTIGLADVKTIQQLWAVNMIARKKQLCKEVMEIKEK